ncbi:RAN GTPase-activating protein 2-like [Brassica napus]|uniref:RAN GTPase-activating protein 2-like n=1 Tax=Brassica napus TaxID=3708 RepID=UPI0006AB6375|nr:RAN GTPase-activating protein 2-like [Brassica napus]
MGFKICFSNRSFGLGAARVAEPILASLKHQLKVEALDVMNLFSNALQGNVLSSLNLSDNALGEKGVRAFGTLLKSLSSLEELYLMNDGISKEAAQAVSELIPSTEKLRLRDEGCIQIEKSVEEDHSKLQYIDMSNNYIRRDGAVALAGVVMKKEAFKLLNIDGNIISEEGVEEVKEMFKKKQSCLGVWMRMILMEKKEMKRMMSWSQS